MGWTQFVQYDIAFIHQWVTTLDDKLRTLTLFTYDHLYFDPMFNLLTDRPPWRGLDRWTGRP